METERDRAARAFDEGRWLDALIAIDPILASGGAVVEDWLFTGQILIKVGEYAQAIQVLETGLELQPDHPELQYERAIAVFHLGDVSKAVEIFERLARQFELFQAWTSLATVIPGCPQANHSRIRSLREEFAARLQKHAANLTASLPQPSSDLVSLEQSAAPWKAGSTQQTGSAVRSEPRRIRVGYISAFFHRANYMKPVWGLINGHDRSRFEIELFADDCQMDQFDWLQTRDSDRVHITSDLDNAAMGDFVRHRSLDIVVDLNAYSVPSRLGIYSRRLAPVVVAWFNMYATSALPGIDWILGDDYVIRPEEEIFYTEQVFRLPHSYLGFVVGHHTPDVVPAPCMTQELFTYGSLVSQYKITPAVLDAWSEILRRVENSRLLLANRAMQATLNREYVIAEFARRGVSQERLLLLPPADHFKFLSYYNQIDLALDTFPYNGGTTTTEAIWQGVPVLALDGDRWASRTSRTLLLNCHLQEFVAPDVRDWIETAVRWGSEQDCRARLHRIRTTMREDLLRSNVCQMPGMIRAMESFYENVLSNRALRQANERI